MTAKRSLAPDHPNLEVQYIEGALVRDRRSFISQEFALPVEYRVPNSNICNLERAVKERVFFVKTEDGFNTPPEPKSFEYFSGQLREFQRKLYKVLPYTTPIQTQQFAELYSGRKREIYRMAADSLLSVNWSVKDARLKAFVKAEKTNLTAKPDFVPRVIQPRDPRFNVEVGRYLKPIEHRVYRAIAKVFGERVVMKGLNSADMGREFISKWEKYSNPVAIGLDASRFDQHVSEVSLRWEHQVYLRCFRRKRTLAALLKCQLQNSAVGYCRDGKLKYSVTGKRMSGDMNTALGNCLLMCGLVYSYCHSIGIGKFSLANNGDDCVVIMEREHLQRFNDSVSTWFVSMGFTMKVEVPVYVFEQIEFCQMHPVLVDHSCLMVRDPRVALSKDTMSLKDLSRIKTYRMWMNAVGTGGLSLTGCLPIWQDYYSSLVRAGKGFKGKLDDTLQGEGLRMLSEGMARKCGKITQSTRYSFYLAFGIEPEMQVAIETHYKSNTPYWHRVDCSDQQDYNGHGYFLPQWA